MATHTIPTLNATVTLPTHTVSHQELEQATDTDLANRINEVIAALDHPRPPGTEADAVRYLADLLIEASDRLTAR